MQFPYPVVPIVAAHHETMGRNRLSRGPVGRADSDRRTHPGSRRLPGRARERPSVPAGAAARGSDAPGEGTVRVGVRPAEWWPSSSPATWSSNSARAGSRSGKAKLSTNVRIANGAAPAAGFAEQAALPESAIAAPGDAATSCRRSPRPVTKCTCCSRCRRPLGTSLSLVDTLSVLAKRLQAVVPHDTFAIYLQREKPTAPRVRDGNRCRASSRRSRFPSDRGCRAGWRRTAKPVLNGNPAVEPGYLNDGQHVHDPQVGALGAARERQRHHRRAFALRETKKKPSPRIMSVSCSPSARSWRCRSRTACASGRRRITRRSTS